ncbi:hypothetical protein ASZ90_007982 [hydrocarbon metagenome]|uniref:Uncharacterized protein n=1 Tax=hydrocarbon metagenome TaxID=938273 RepID=A0A0W8FMV5_9ZZZZ
MNSAPLRLASGIVPNPDESGLDLAATTRITISATIKRDTAIARLIIIIFNQEVFSCYPLLIDMVSPNSSIKFIINLLFSIPL